MACIFVYYIYRFLERSVQTFTCQKTSAINILHYIKRSAKIVPTTIFYDFLNLGRKNTDKRCLNGYNILHYIKRSAKIVAITIFYDFLNLGRKNTDKRCLNGYN